MWYNIEVCRCLFDSWYLGTQRIVLTGFVFATLKLSSDLRADLEEVH